MIGKLSFVSNEIQWAEMDFVWLANFYLNISFNPFWTGVVWLTMRNRGGWRLAGLSHLKFLKKCRPPWNQKFGVFIWLALNGPWAYLGKVKKRQCSILTISGQKAWFSVRGAGTKRVDAFLEISENKVIGVSFIV